MRLFSDNNKSSITIYIDKLSNIDEIEWFLFQQLTESIIIQDSGPKEAIEAIRKKLKHGTFHQKLRVLEILKLLMENSNQRFHRELVTNAKMKDRFDAILESHTEDNRIRMTVINLLGMWSSKYKKEPGMKSFGQLYDRNRLNKLYSVNNNNNNSLSKGLSSPFSLDNKKVVAPPALQPNIPAPNHIQPNHSQPNNKRVKLDKSKVKQDIALANQSAQNLINAIKYGGDIDDLILKCEENKKNIIRYTRLLEDDEFIGKLLTVNEVLLKALEMIPLEDPFADPI